MKKVIRYIIVLMIIVVSATACDFNAPLRNQMLNYYSIDENYKELTGTIAYIDKNMLGVRLQQPGYDFLKNAETDCSEFVLIDDFIWSDLLNVDDEIVFVSAPMHFYNGHQLPIISLTKNEETLLEFEDGKTMYLEWIQQTFG